MGQFTTVWVSRQAAVQRWQEVMDGKVGAGESIRHRVTPPDVPSLDQLWDTAEFARSRFAWVYRFPIVLSFLGAALVSALLVHVGDHRPLAASFRDCVAWLLFSYFFLMRVCVAFVAAFSGFSLGIPFMLLVLVIGATAGLVGFVRGGLAVGRENARVVFRFFDGMLMFDRGLNTPLGDFDKFFFEMIATSLIPFEPFVLLMVALRGVVHGGWREGCRQAGDLWYGKAVVPIWGSMLAAHQGVYGVFLTFAALLTCAIASRMEFSPEIVVISAICASIVVIWLPIIWSTRARRLPRVLESDGAYLIGDTLFEINDDDAVKERVSVAVREGLVAVRARAARVCELAEQRRTLLAEGGDAIDETVHGLDALAARQYGFAAQLESIHSRLQEETQSLAHRVRDTRRKAELAWQETQIVRERDSTAKCVTVSQGSARALTEMLREVEAVVAESERTALEIAQSADNGLSTAVHRS